MRQDHRRLERRKLVFRFEVVDRETGRTLGYLVDLTVEGLMLMASRPLEVGRVYHCRMLIQGHAHLDFEARSCWLKPSITPGYHDAGFSISRIAAEDSARLYGLIHRYKMHD